MTMNNLMLPTRTSEPFNNNFSPIFIRNQSVDSFFGDNDRRGGIYDNDPFMHDYPFDNRRGLNNNRDYPFDFRNMNDNPFEGPRGFHNDPEYSFDGPRGFNNSNPGYPFKARKSNDYPFEGQSGLYNEPFDGRRNYENPQIQHIQRNQSNIRRINHPARSFPSFLPRWHKPMWPWLIFLPLGFLFLEVFIHSLLFILLKIIFLKGINVLSHASK
jgi:hypothetical protein